MRVALFGNPNTGKTSLFNLLTGSYEYVGNWSGVTVEKKVGLLHEGLGELIDLPGIYSLTPLSKDEEVSTAFLMEESYDAILNIVDASQLSRNLHLTLQLLELNKPMIIALNMIDVAEKRGIHCNHQLLEERLGIPVIPMIARSGKGVREILDALRGIGRKEVLEEGVVFTYDRKDLIDYGPTIEKKIAELEREMNGVIPARFYLLRSLEGNKTTLRRLFDFIQPRRWESLQSELMKELNLTGDDTLAEYLYHYRQKRIDQLLDGLFMVAVDKNKPFTDRVDYWLTHPVFGMPIFFALLFLMFQLTFDWLGTPISDLLDSFFNGPLREFLTFLLSSLQISPVISSIVLDGLLAGVGGVLVFVPQIFLLFFFISFIEDSGYMARVALVMDRIMEKIGLNGKAFIPMIIGFGCNVPGVMAARTIEQPKERLLTILLTPLMSCSARLAVYSLFVGVFFEKYQAIIVLSLYVLGVVVAFLMAWIFSSTILKSEESLFIVELPPYRFPHALTLWRSTWEKGKGFVRKAGTVIFGGTVLIWLLSYLGPKGVDVPMNESFLSMIGGLIAPILIPLGFGTWQAAAALITGFLAKEIVVSTMNILYYAPDENSLLQAISHAFTPLSAYSFMVFILLYIPCLATTATISRESGSLKWTLVAIGYSFVVAYLLSFMVYQGGKLLGFS